MSIAVFDTYAFVKRLTAAGMPEPQAEVLADEQRRLIDDRLATKEDITRLGADIARLSADIARLGAATAEDIARLGATTAADIARLEAVMAKKSDLAETKAEILKWMFGQTVLILGAVLAIGRFQH